MVCNTIVKTLEASQALLIEIDCNFNINYINKTFEKLLGHNKKELLNNNFIKFIVPSRFKNSVKLNLNEVINLSGFKANFIFPAIDSSGIEHLINWNIFIKKGVNNNAEGFLFLGFDLKNSNRAHFEREKLFKLSPDIFAVISFEGIMKQVNPSFKNVLGFDKNETVSEHFFKFVHPDDKKQIIKAVQLLTSKNKIVNFKCRTLTKSSDYLWIDWVCFSEKHNQLIFTVGRNITKEIIAENNLKKSQKRTLTILNNIFDYFIEINNDLTIISANEKIAKLFNKSFENVIGKKLSVIFTQPEHSVIFNKLQTAIETKKNAEFEYYYNTHNLWFEFKVYPQNSNLYIYFIDITDKKNHELEKEDLIKTLEKRNSEVELAYENEKKIRKRLEETKSKLQRASEETEAANEEMTAAQVELEVTNLELEIALNDAQKASKAKDEFLAILSHELRTPLTGIIGFSSLLEEDENLDCKQRKISKYLMKSGERLKRIIDDLLELSLIEAGIVKVKYENVSVKEIINDIYIMFEFNIKKKNIELFVDLHNVEVIYTDPLRIRQILFNLIGNAVKFTQNGKISILLEEKNNEYIFEISDTGIGIDKKNQKIIFKMFKQVEDVSKRVYQGAGVGLTISKKLVKALGGDIRVKSLMGKGSSFFIYLPKKVKTKVKVYL